MSARKAKRQPPKVQAPQVSPRMGATLEQVENRVAQIQFDLLEFQSLLKVSSDALRLDNVTESDADDVCVVLKIGATSLDKLIGKLDELTWTDAEVERCASARVARKGGEQ